MGDTMPQWMRKHPCEACGTGYGACAQGLGVGVMCCASCSHPGRWQPDPYTADEIVESWGARELDDFTKRAVRRLREKERRP